MQMPDLHITAHERHELTLLPDMLARPLERLKLQHRAEKYRFKEDRGGIDYVRRNVRPGDTVFDIGAHKAGYLYFFLEQMGSAGKIFAFEPQSVLHQYLLRLKQLFSWDNVTIESAAVSDRLGTALLCVPQNHGRQTSPCATIIESHMRFQYQLQEEVRTVPLDEYCRQLQLFPDFLKVDVEGNELAVFKGAKNILRTCHPKIIFECEARFVGPERMQDTFDFLDQLGYMGYFIHDDTILPLQQFSAKEHQGDNAKCYCNNFIFEQNT